MEATEDYIQTSGARPAAPMASVDAISAGSAVRSGYVPGEDTAPAGAFADESVAPVSAVETASARVAPTPAAEAAFAGESVTTAPVAPAPAAEAASAPVAPAAEAASAAAIPATFTAPAPDPSVAPKKGGAFYFAVKRVFDFVFSLVVCAVLAIPVAIICLVICIDSPGKPFFRQERVGQYGRKIRIIKLRTMVSDAHTNPERYMTPEQLAVWKREQKVDDDPRLTRMGKWLRRSSLDELPQFLNVLAGSLSVIGPRPVTESETYEFGAARDEFLSCKPGITGWWQVISRNDSNWEDGSRQLIELFYVRHQSFALDTRIFVRTFKAMKKGQ